MGRQATGQVIAPRGRQKSWAIRFRANGRRRYRSLGRSRDGWNRRRAEAELRHELAAVEAGTWRASAAPVLDIAPTFGELAARWLADREPELRPKSIASYKWQLNHLLPAFGSMRLDEITPADVDAFKATLLRTGAVAPGSINKQLGTLSRILGTGRRYGIVDRNPVEDVDRLKTRRPARPTIEPEQLPTMLDAAGPLRPIVAVLAGAGLRPAEACALSWRDVSLSAGQITVGRAKTDAGRRRVDAPRALRELLTDHKAEQERRAGDPVFTNKIGNRYTVTVLERRFKTAVKRANRRLVELGIDPVDDGATPYSLRRAYASVRYALGDDPPYVAEQMGHRDGGALSMRVYASAVCRRARLEGAALEEFDRALSWAEIGPTPGVDLDPKRSTSRSPPAPSKPGRGA